MTPVGVGRTFEGLWRDGVAMTVAGDRATAGRNIDELPRLPGLPLAGSAVALCRDALPVLDRARRLGEVVRLAVGPVGARNSAHDC